MVQGVYTAVPYGPLYRFLLGNIKPDRGAGVGYFLGEGAAVPCGDDVLIAVPFPQGRHQFGAKLSGCAGDQYALHWIRITASAQEGQGCPVENPPGKHG